MPADFLMQQMAWREALEDAKNLQEMEEISSGVNRDGREQLLKIERSIDLENDYPAAAQQVRSLMFIERFASEVDARIDQLGQ
jgi:molecular chaperone HscB